MFQSAPGLEAGRCLVTDGDVYEADEFQSAPGLEAGRCQHPAHIRRLANRAVSIRARPRGRAMPGPTARSAATRPFQSAPGLEAGRCVRSVSWISSCSPFQSAPGLEAGRCPSLALKKATCSTFQSAPGLEAGRCEVKHDQPTQMTRVSIRARPRGRAMQHAPVLGMDRRMFQSAPGLEAGRCHRTHTVRQQPHPVSIRARPRGRAMLALSLLR